MTLYDLQPRIAIRAKTASPCAPGAAGSAPPSSLTAGTKPDAANTAASPLDVGALGLMPCLGPIATLSDTRQTLTLHFADDFVITAWASHFSPMKYDVKAGTYEVCENVVNSFPCS